MNNLKIWGRISSLNVRKVVLAAQWIGLDFERTDAGRAFGIVQTPAYLQLNPNAMVPTLQQGDFVLWESNVIVRYLCARYSPGTLCPTDLQRRFDAERWMDWQQTTFNPAGGAAFVQWIRTPPEQRDPAVIARSTAATEPLLALLDGHLSQQPWMAGESVTMADFPLACEMHRWFGLPAEHAAQPLGHYVHLARWYAQLCAHPASRGVLDLALS